MLKRLKYTIKENGKRVATGAERRTYAARMTRKPTGAESRFMARLDAAGIPYKFQEPLSMYIADFLIPSRMLVIEIDGGYHDDPQTKWKDDKRDEHLSAGGLHVVRIRNEDVDSWPLETITKLRVRVPKSLSRAKSRLNSLRHDMLRGAGLLVSRKELAKIQTRFGLQPDQSITAEQVAAWRREKRGLDPTK
jgi:very-short-patch-repair endonuclease